MGVDVLTRIREAVLDGRHRFSKHAVFELAKDRFGAADAEAAILTGTIRREEPDGGLEHPGPRYTVVGTGCDLMARLAIVCRFETDLQLLIITGYTIQS